MALDVSQVRQLAQHEGWVEVQFNTTSRVIAFKRGDQRVNVYYTTGTVGTALDHPRSGKTQLFRRGMDLNSLRDILRDPRTHTGVGYYRRHEPNNPEPSYGGELHPWARFTTMSRDQDTFLNSFDGSSVTRVALGRGYFVLQHDGGTWWNNIPKGLDNKLRGRQKWLPSPDYVSLGPDDYYFVQFVDGHQQWSGPDSLTEELQSYNSEVEILAFAPDDGWYVQYSDGRYTWDNIPIQLHNQLKPRINSNRPGVEELSIGPEGEWFVRYSDGDWRANNLPSQIGETMDEEMSKGRSIANAVFGEDGAWVLLCG